MSAAIHRGQSLTLEEYRAEQSKTDAKLEQIADILQQIKTAHLERTATALRQMKREYYSVEGGH